MADAMSGVWDVIYQYVKTVCNNLDTAWMCSCSPISAEAAGEVDIHTACAQELGRLQEDWGRVTTEEDHRAAGGCVGRLSEGEGIRCQCVCGHALLDPLHRRRHAAGEDAALPFNVSHIVQMS